ncbi:MAG: phosphate ABC transporter ATP-binding protein PstB [Thaumarchaeota archaeon]|nr:phosphate ABC transporter ATP-binding protein PstB [Nitrososphaerota archaeon]RNJ73034.1 MAG: phosphate ABC transporter ATP-binding protein [Thaumarchaeota archaeon S13]RNJ76659.1 MAG: phosphate ABC transporter ATP-binding protein [Thaumarchaeota archaeon S15]MDD9808538.1 phosphate ABC transporter ATP-binding protein PstB [Nitrososphaerota archaeon]MDD9813108.1 phosphate ABC transporter ATP-binding protein PstB [Nitrososphaerota archaeon]
MTAEGVSVLYSGKEAVRNVTMGFKERSVTALIGPSGCGKTTFLRCLNRMHDMTPGAVVTGRITLDGVDLYSRDVDPIYHRRKVGMVFQKPNPFPTMSVYDNVVAGLRLNGVRDRRALDEIAEDSLRMAFLWDEVSDSLSKPAVELSGGQQQRLCIARALAIQPEVLLMDEPASALDPIATQKIEEAIVDLKRELAVIIVTHNMQQAVRISDYTGFMYMGDLIEFRDTRKLFTDPRHRLTEQYVKGTFG